MNFLQLVQKLRQRTGGASSPSSVVGQTGEALDYVDWTSEAWDNIQTEEPDWMWMRKDATFNTTSGTSAYLPPAMSPTPYANVAKWRVFDSARCYTTALGRIDEGYLGIWSYQDWRDGFDFGLQSTVLSRPSILAVRDADNAILVGPTPNAAYSISLQYQCVPTTMTANADVPGLPLRFHMLIVYKAMMLYAAHEAAPEVYSEGEREYNKMMAALRLDQLETIHFGAPLA